MKVALLGGTLACVLAVAAPVRAQAQSQAQGQPKLDDATAQPPAVQVAQPPSTTPDPGPPPTTPARPTDAEAPPAPVTAPPSKIVIPPDPNAAAAMVRIPRLRYANTWDLNLEAGVGTVFRDANRLAVLGRGRAGMLFVRDDHFWQLGVTAEYLTKVERPAFGLQAEYLNLEKGLWAQLGANMDTKGRPGGMAALGLSIVGVEVQVREFEGDGDVHAALLGKIRIPIGIIAYALGQRGGKF